MPDSAQKTVQYIVTRSKRKSVALYVRNNIVEVRAPDFVSKKEIHHWVHSKADWIEQRLSQQQQRLSEQPIIDDGATFLFMGEQRQIHIRSGKNTVKEDNADIIIESRQPDDEEKNQALLERWLKQEAQHYINERCLELAQRMQVNEQISAIKYRKTKTKWGHCTSRGVLQFNWLIIMAPVDVIDYLLIHELSHLTHMNHSSQFWQRVKAFCPEFKQHKNWLNTQGHKITL